MAGCEPLVGANEGKFSILRKS